MDDEIGQLAESFRTMQNSMRVKTQSAIEISEGNLLTDIQPLSDKDSMGIAFQTMVAKLRLQLKDISEGINVLASSSSEIMASVTQLASNSAETATSVGETTTTVEEVKQTAMVSNQRAKLVSENSIKIADISKEGNRAIANTIEGMSRIKQHMGAIANMVVKLSEQSQTIGEITASVNELAEQSNLLAVNAAIEAAKAGEQGKGFTVVAQEIKMLAERSKEATAQVRVILRDVQKSISSAVMATEEGTKAVEEGLKLTNQSGDTIRILSESVAEAANVAIQIAASSQQQLEGMDQVVVAMENIREASTQTVISTQQSVDSVNDLQKVGQKLDALMKQYRLFK
jgi:methyl-accepting chemotaxis protein